jgi:hypothetical protein
LKLITALLQIFTSKMALASIYDAWIDQLQSIHEGIENGNGAVVNAVVNTIMNFDIGTKWKITHSVSVFGANSPLDLIQKAKE